MRQPSSLPHDAASAAREQSLRAVAMDAEVAPTRLALLCVHTRLAATWAGPRSQPTSSRSQARSCGCLNASRRWVRGPYLALILPHPVGSIRSSDPTRAPHTQPPMECVAAHSFHPQPMGPNSPQQAVANVGDPQVKGARATNMCLRKHCTSNLPLRVDGRPEASSIECCRRGSAGWRRFQTIAA